MLGVEEVQDEEQKGCGCLRSPLRILVINNRIRPKRIQDLGAPADLRKEDERDESYRREQEHRDN